MSAMGASANVKSIDAIRRFRGDLREFEQSLRQTLDILSTELKRTLDYFESDRASYWPTQARLASERLAEARGNLQRRRIVAGPGAGPSCVEEKKAFERAKRRLLLAERKVKETRKWGRIVRQEIEQFQTRLAQLTYLSESELPRAAVLLARLAQRLDRYVQRADGEPPPASTSRSSDSE